MIDDLILDKYRDDLVDMAVDIKTAWGCPNVSFLDKRHQEAYIIAQFVMYHNLVFHNWKSIIL